MSKKDGNNSTRNQQAMQFSEYVDCSKSQVPPWFRHEKLEKDPPRNLYQPMHALTFLNLLVPMYFLNC